MGHTCISKKQKRRSATSVEAYVFHCLDGISILVCKAKASVYVTIQYDLCLTCSETPRRGFLFSGAQIGINSIIYFLNLKFQEPGLCRTWLETRRPGCLVTWLKYPKEKIHILSPREDSYKPL